MTICNYICGLHNSQYSHQIIDLHMCWLIEFCTQKEADNVRHKLFANSWYLLKILRNYLYFLIQPLLIKRLLLSLISSLSHPPYIIIIFSVSLEVVMSSSSAEPRARSRRQPPRSTMNRNCRPPEIQLVNNWYSRRRESESAREEPRYPVV